MIEGAKEQENEIEGGERRMLQTGFLLFELSWQSIVPLGLYRIQSRMIHLYIESIFIPN